MITVDDNLQELWHRLLETISNVLFLSLFEAMDTDFDGVEEDLGDNEMKED